MGIPKFYRWTSERYPCLSEIIKEYQIPEFDNLYLDMNGIIHNCSHPNDEDVHLRIPEEQIFKDIFHYIDFLFKMIKPCKVFFMAVDGVAPRAKMNQQRGRRFRSAKLAEDQETEAIRKGEVLPSEDRFDSNCITPGTEFMARLHEQLKYFVQVKVSTDPLWQRSGLVVYLSGHDVPGEGEHKIMDFLRHIRSKPDYNPTTRHCLYGLDADLVMLGLSTHELQFSLLREEVKFSRAKKSKKGVKRPPKQKNGLANYDLTNVSIFTNENNPVASAASMLKAPDPGKSDINLVNIIEGKSFANALETQPKIPEPAHTNGSSNNETIVTNGDTDELVPPAPDDSKAKGVFRAPLPEKTTFLLLHLSLMRDYIDFEFQDLKTALENHPKIEYDLEKVIDDWILMNILVGNDFVPHLPHLHIVKGALPMLYRTYTEVLPNLDGYLNENGILNLTRFEAFIKALSKFDIEIFRETYDDMEYMESKTGKNIVLGEKMFEGFDFEQEDNFTEEALEPMSPELKALAQRTEEEVFGEQKNGAGKLCADVFRNDDDYFEQTDSPEFRLEFLQHKRNYYISKLQFEEISTEFLESFCREYIRAIQWVLLYYYKGVSSWGWFYPFHYAPFSSDLRNFASFQIEFDKGQPFRPFEQLLAVLPAQSKKLLPHCYQWLMTDDESPIVDFYPEKFEQDLNGKKQDWEAVILIPFIDEIKLLNVMETEEIKLSREELHRNSRGSMMCYSYSKEETGPIKSPRDLFPPIENSHVTTVGMDEVGYDPNLLPKGIHPKAKLDTIYQGFPTLKSKPVKCVIEKAEIKVFEFVTREESMVLSLEDVNDDAENVETLARKLIGRSVWVNWPHLTYAYVTGVLTRQGKYIEGYGEIVKDSKLVESRAEKEFDCISKGLAQRHLKCKGMKLGKLNVIIYAKMMEGRKVRCDSKGQVFFDTQWSKLEQPFALKTSICEERITEIFYLDRNIAKTYLDLFKFGDQVLYLGDKLFGALGTVTGHDEAKASVLVKFEIPPYGNEEFNLKNCIGRSTLKSHEYFSSHNAAVKCQISSYVLSRITGTVFISIEKETKAHKKEMARKAALSKKASATSMALESSLSDSSSEEDFPALEMKKINVGLDLKFNKKNLEVRGYTSKRDGLWYYSGKAIQLVNEFVVRFSDFVGFLGRSEKGKDVFEASEIFPRDPLGNVNEMVDWLDEKGIRELPRIPTNTNLLDDDDIDSVWKYILKTKSLSKRPTVKKWSVRPNLLLKPGLDRGCVPPIPNSTFEMLDRVICVDRGAPIPVGHRGTIVGIQTPQSSEPEQIEESFKSTGAATLMTLIVLSDPAPGVFDKPEDFGIGSTQSGSQNVEELTGALASLLGCKAVAPTEKDNPVPIPAKKDMVVDLKPRLIKLYPYQIINLSLGPTVVREKQKNATHANPINSIANGLLPKSSQREMNSEWKGPVHAIQPTQPIRILQRPTTSATGGQQIQNPFTNFTSKQVEAARAKALANLNAHKALATLQAQKPKSKQIPKLMQQQPGIQAMPVVQQCAPNQATLPWPPQPLMSTPIEQFFSAAAFAQQQQSSKTAASGNILPGNPFAHIIQQGRGQPSGKSRNNPGGANAPSKVPQNLAAQIFSPDTAFHEVNRNKQQQSNAPKQGQNIMQLLSHANEQYQSRSANRVIPSMQLAPAQQPVSLPRQNTGSQQYGMQADSYQSRQNRSLETATPRMPAPPTKWLAHHQEPLPQHHGFNYGPNGPPPFPASFVPLQVDRNRAYNNDGRNHQQKNRNQNNQSRRTQAHRNQSLPAAVMSASAQADGNQKGKKEQQNTQDRVDEKPRKSRIAANFGNMP